MYSFVIFCEIVSFMFYVCKSDYDDNSVLTARAGSVHRLLPYFTRATEAFESATKTS